MSKPILVSGIQPSGQLMIGNYIGAIKQWVALQDDHDAYFCLVDLHSLTVTQDPKALHENCYDALALYIACGIDPEKSTLFMQSHVPEHTELAWLLNCFTHMGLLNRMTQFKDKSQQHAKNINAGLFTYPVLMAADILLYDADIVPVGDDQKQHLELARELANRFNHRFGEVFNVPEPYIPAQGSRIMSLQEPSQKMSKSDANQNSFIALLDASDVARKKIMRCVTDSDNEIRFDAENKPGLSNLLTLFASVSGESIDNLVLQYQHQGYGALKTGCADAVVAFLEPIQEKFRQIRPEIDELNKILRAGKVKAQAKASMKLSRVKEVLGLIV